MAGGQLFGKGKSVNKMFFLIVSLLIVCLFVCVALYKFSSSSGWEKINAVILRSELETLSQGLISSSSQGDSRISYKVNIEYKYSVGEQDYIGNNVYAGIGNVISDKHEAEKLVMQYTVGDNVSIYYDSVKPNNSALRSSKGFAWRLILVVVFIFVIGGVIFNFVLKNLDF